MTDSQNIRDLVPDSHHDLLDATGVAAFVTLDAKGRPQTTAVWFIVEDGLLKTSISDTRQKFKNLSANTDVGFFFVDPANPFHTLEVRATAELRPDPDKSFLERVFARYGADPTDYVELDDHRYEVVLTPWHITTNG
ncbi:MAG: PPOX class F420-dependent oxidoreductase [Nocardioides sp.]|uniref:PPOX class F420-dependent oxidoreductase n=1 Tax=Nocardioides sp. TaxID=35761 RepID=UPI0039E3B0B9